ncbi:hypothetical protein [Bacillus sp. ISL-7]|uniref:hypothetical protein n=1 Tax=Bacillus sp. ISL-7 TaxID=2819136 RepID=UPI001BE5DF76|nr:hypothetical protein [Bacillus sp. ISL-7]MBT2733679.1 hypothetical protein [Bacillus sp. ISL-7]
MHHVLLYVLFRNLAYEKNLCKVTGCSGPNGSGDGNYILDLTNPKLLLKEFELQSLRERVEYLQPLKEELTEELKKKRQEIAAAKVRLNEVNKNKAVKILRK